MIEHPCKGMTKAQIDAFERIAVNDAPNCTWPVIDALLARGVIVRGADEIHRDALGVYHVPRFCVPLAVHHQWCEWCSEHSA
jgi:hypothetical protein